MAIPINSKMKPRVEKGFALMDAEDIEYKDGKRLPDFLFQCVTQEEYDDLVKDGAIKPDVPYLIIDERDDV